MPPFPHEKLVQIGAVLDLQSALVRHWTHFFDTVLQNGVLVQLDQEIHGETGHRIVPGYTHKSGTGPLAFGGHGCPVRFRNLWLRPL